jgi:serine protease
MPTNVPGGSLSTALDIKVSNTVQVFQDTVDSLQSIDFYRFGLQGRSSFYLSLNRFRGDLNVELVRDANNDGVAQSSEVITFSRSLSRKREFISTDLDRGTYYIRVYANDGTASFYNLSVSATPESDAIPPLPKISQNGNIPISTSTGNSSNVLNTQILPTLAQTPSAPTTSWKLGTLGADTFTYDRSSQITYVSGNGDIDFGAGKRDTLDLKTAGISLGQVSFNWATAAGGGVKSNPGNGDRIFDAITLNDNYQILFEGIEQIQFSDVTYDFASNTPLPGASPDFKPIITTSDEKFNQQWNLFATGVHNAQRFTTGTTNVLIGIADSGLAVDANGQIHPGLQSRAFAAGNYLDPNHRDETTAYSHGTLVQSVIAGATNNLTGINWGSNIAQIDVLGGDAGDKDLLTATQTLMQLAQANGSKPKQKLVVNWSLSGGATPELISLIDSLQKTSNDVLFVVSVGNDNNSNIQNPAALAGTYNNVMSIGSSWGNTDWYGIAKTPGQRVDYSNSNPELTPQQQTAYTKWWGPNYAADTSNKTLTLMAPTEFFAANADYVPANASTNQKETYNFNYRDKFNGTSASAPMVTGIASLVWSANPNLTAGQVKDILSKTAVDLGAAGYDKYYGYGFVNADAAVRSALAIARA